MLLDKKRKFVNRYEDIKSEPIKDAMKVYHYFSLFSHDILDKLRFIEVSAPIIDPATDPSVRGSKRVKFDYYGYRCKVMSSYTWWCLVFFRQK